MIEQLYSGWAQLAWVVLGVETDRNNPYFGHVFVKFNPRHNDIMGGWKELFDLNPMAKRIAGITGERRLHEGATRHTEEKPG